MSQLEVAILKTVAYFDIFDYPLTSFEIWQYLEIRTTLLEVEKILQSHTLSLEEKFGFFFLPNRQGIVDTRQERYRVTDKKIKKLKRRLRLIQWLPGIRLICLANSIGAHNLRRQSDSDLFIVTRSGYLWWVKLWATIILQFTGLRPTATRSTDTLCLSFLVDDSALDLSRCRLKHDRYFTYWLSCLTPLYGDLVVYQELFTSNSWLQAELPNWSMPNNQPLYRLKLKKTTAASPNHLQHWLEKQAQILQRRIMSPTLRTSANQTTQVIVTDHILKLHTSDRRDYFQTEFNKRLSALSLNEQSL